jgi:hypothetical protein
LKEHCRSPISFLCINVVAFLLTGKAKRDIAGLFFQALELLVPNTLWVIANMKGTQMD